MTKPELRNTIRTRLEALSPEQRRLQSQALCRAIVASPEWQAARCVGLFSPLPTEPDLHLLWAEMGERRACYPRVVGEELVFLHVPSRSALLPSRWGLLEPVLDPAQIVAPEAIDLLLVPGLAFTRDGHRMGRGRGYYDRFLAPGPDQGSHTTTAGICFAQQIVPHVPMEDHDQPMARLFCA